MQSLCVSFASVWKVVAAFLSPTAFALGTVNFADYERAHVGLRWSNMWQVHHCYFGAILFHLESTFLTLS
jgi:hypothetical protein